MTFTYDSDSDYYFLKHLFNKANREFLLNDFDLLGTDKEGYHEILEANKQ